MVHLRSITTFAGTALCLVGLVQSNAGAGPQSNNPRLTLKVLTGQAQDACSSQQVDALKKHKVEAVELAEAGSKALNTRGVEFSDAFTSFLGIANPKQMEINHYAPVVKLRSVDIEPVSNDAGHLPDTPATAPPGETLFTCLTKADPRCSEKDGSASGVIALSSSEEHTIRLCPAFFGKVTMRDPTDGREADLLPMSLADAKKPYLDGEDEYDKILPGRTLFHEFQHAPTVVGNARVNDLYIRLDAPHIVVPRPSNPRGSVVAANYLSDCMGLPSHLKRLNAQNLAFFGLDVWADPGRARPKGFGSGSSKKTSKRFEAIYQRGAEKAAAAQSGAKDTPKPAAEGATGTEKAEDKAVSAYKRPHLGFTVRPKIVD